MKLLFYFFSVSIFFFLLSSQSIIVCSSPQENNVLYNGFKQFLGDIRNYECEPMSGGLSYNVQYLCIVNDKKYVVRVLKEPLSTRQSEVSVCFCAADKDIAPEMYYYQHNDEFSFIIIDFIDVHTLSLEQARSHEVLNLMAQNIRAMHQFDPNVLLNNNKRDLFVEITKNYKKIKTKNFFGLYPILEKVLRKAEIINQKIKSKHRPFVFNHNDLHPRNIFFTDNKVVIIDWEMAALNDEFYDLASYSMFACLSQEDDLYLLTQYLQNYPSDADIQHFRIIKLMSRVFDVFSVFAFLDYIPKSIPMEAIKSFAYYQNIFAQDSKANSVEFLYVLAISQMQEFFKEYKSFENDHRNTLY